MELILLPFLDSGLYGILDCRFLEFCATAVFKCPTAAFHFVAQDLIAFQNLPELCTKKLLVHACY